MQNETSQDILTEMDALLEHERTALLTGDLDALPDLMAVKETLIDKLSRLTMPEQTELAALHVKAERNQLLMDHALAGIRDVAKRMSDLRRTEKSLETYDSLGRRKMISTASRGTVEKRA